MATLPWHCQFLTGRLQCASNLVGSFVHFYQEPLQQLFAVLEAAARAATDLVAEVAAVLYLQIGLECHCGLTSRIRQLNMGEYHPGFTWVSNNQSRTRCSSECYCHVQDRISGQSTLRQFYR